tara:strand:+ start:779 stop:949 length:171 start_codon:yes stop_codon:yes gene_type:complete
MQIDFKKANQLIITCDDSESFVVETDRNGGYHIDTYCSNHEITTRLVEQLKEKIKN